MGHTYTKILFVIYLTFKFNLVFCTILLMCSWFSWLIGKDSDDGRDRGQEEKGKTEDEMAGWHHWHDGRESEWTLGVDDGQGGLVCCNSWDRKELDTTERLNWTELIYKILYSCVQHNDSLFLHIMLNCKLLQDNGYNSLCYTIYSCCLSILYTVVCIC